MYRATRFQPSSPDAKANGQVLMPYFEVLKGSKLQHLIPTYHLDQLDPNIFYPQKTVCDMQFQMSKEMGLFSGELVNIGIKSIDSIGFPPEVKTLHNALDMLHQIYQAIHQGVPAEEGWLFESLSDTKKRIFFNSPYEPFAAYGYIYAIAKRFKPSETDSTVEMKEEEGLTVYYVEFK
ncbi:MAG TPA: hypothetical protein VHP83_01860 [Aggregatilineaceae bacterium]|nr:hypothetical protein [Aggregatilineaceae bacterium]